MQIRCALVGMPGSGKSTVGRHLAQRLGVPFIDLDHQLEQVLKTSIRQFFEAEGEARFRDIEAQVLAEVTARPGGMVLSTGGGAVLRPENRQVLRDFGNVLYLRASPEEIFKRVKHDRTPPPAAGEQPPAKTARAVCPARCAVPRSSHLRDRNRPAHGADAGQHDHDAAGDGAPPPGRASKSLRITIKTIAGCAF